MIDIDLRNGDLHAVKLIQIENEVDEIFQLLVPTFGRQSRETLEQRKADIQMDALLLSLGPDGLFEYLAYTVAES